MWTFRRGKLLIQKPVYYEGDIAKGVTVKCCCVLHINAHDMEDKLKYFTHVQHYSKHLWNVILPRSKSEN